MIPVLPNFSEGEHYGGIPDDGGSTDGVGPERPGSGSYIEKKLTGECVDSVSS